MVNKNEKIKSSEITPEVKDINEQTLKVKETKDDNSSMKTTKSQKVDKKPEVKTAKDITPEVKNTKNQTSEINDSSPLVSGEDDKDKTAKVDETKKRSSCKKAVTSEQVPENKPSHFPIVGIGASAGGLEAFKAFFSETPVDSGMAFVVVQHLDPSYKSKLDEILQRHTKMKVVEAEDGMAVQPNCVYIIPPGRDLAILKGSLQVSEPSHERGHRMPVDFFFESLAQEDHPIGIVLSGTGEDGTLGIKAINAAGGMVLAQSPETAEYSDMPINAADTGLVDLVLPPDEMPASLSDYANYTTVKNEDSDETKDKKLNAKKNKGEKRGKYDVNDGSPLVSPAEDEEIKDEEPEIRDAKDQKPEAKKTKDRKANENADDSQNDSEDSPNKIPIVGIGASAGGLAAFESFFAGMPADSNPDMAFVLVQHLAPDHKSILTEIIQRYTRMKVFEVTDGVEVQPNCAYIIPPGQDMAFLNGSLHLLEPSAPRGHRLPIDFFFQSLAQDQHERAIGIILSGTGSDGTLGIRAIKGEGGMVIAQSPESAEYDGMPISAIETGLVDFVIAPNDMPAQIMAYVAHAFVRYPYDFESQPKLERILNKIFILIRSQTGHDFSEYKASTILRRIERRMAVHAIDSKEEYLRYLQKTPVEVEELFRDLLIGVTNFFRDPKSFEALESEVIPQLFLNKNPDTQIRIWSAGCSTGEEAYSVAILIQEHIDTLKKSYNVKIFGTDIDTHAIETARAGLYPASIAADLTPERLARFFTLEPDGANYRIHKSIRNMLIFSEQDMIKDPPFSKIDLISCRNVMIYMSGILQKKLIPLFHYALKPGGYLFLGSSETIGENGDLFKVLDQKSKLYQSKEIPFGEQRMKMNGIIPPLSLMNPMLPHVTKRIGNVKKLPLREITEQALLQQVGLSAALVNSIGDILYLHGRTGMYLEPVPGESGTNNILKMAREGLRHKLTMALQSAVVKKEIVEYPNVLVKTNSHFTGVNLTVRRVVAGLDKRPEALLYLVVFEDTKTPAHLPEQQVCLDSIEVTKSTADEVGSSQVIDSLKNELQAKDEYLLTIKEELETSNEDLKSTNEEMQSINEEMQSVNEELETSKEELQSVNEELATVNGELQIKVEDLSQANNDMNNLLAGTEIATIFLNQKMEILRFTPAATQIINLIQGDIGRPVGHIVPNLVDYNCLVQDTRAVLKSLSPKEIEVQTMEGKFYTMRILPYRTQNNVVEGAVINFIDITKNVTTREALRTANTELLRLAVVVRDSHDAVTVQDLEGNIKAWNPSAVKMYGYNESEALLMNVSDLIPENLVARELEKINQLTQSKILKPYQTRRIAKDESEIEIWMTSSALLNGDGKMYAIATTERSESGGA
ncbi:MAG: chemotaxis protein CheB [Acetobacterium sp.]